MISNSISSGGKLLAALLAGAVLSACKPKIEPPNIPFAPYDKAYASKRDFAEVEYKYPLSTADLQKLTPESFETMDQEQIDQVYGRLTAGPIPDGPYEGTALFPKGMTGERRVAEIVGGLPGYVANLKGYKIEKIAEFMWKGKVFYRGEGILRNQIQDIEALKKIGLVDKDIQKQEVNGEKLWLLFPAKLYCGQSLLDARRESVIIDYFFTDEVKGYTENPDFLAGRRGLRVRDEIRIVRPGFYLGRAYVDKMFLLNFTLRSKEVEKRDGEAFLKSGQVQEDCWPGTQVRKVQTASK